jgi:hypothetical protein
MRSRRNTFVIRRRGAEKRRNHPGEERVEMVD